jgi:hypothetical protein
MRLFIRRHGLFLALALNAALWFGVIEAVRRAVH